MKGIVIAVIILSILDLTASFLYIRKFAEKNPKIDPTIIEVNPILKFSMKTFGITAGFIYGACLVFGIIILIVFSFAEKYLFYFAGAQSMMMIYHILNFKLLMMN